jgi:hypothetical protein
MLAQFPILMQSGGGLPHHKTLRTFITREIFRRAQIAPL